MVTSLRILAVVLLFSLAGSSAHAQGFTHKEETIRIELSHTVDLKNAQEPLTLASEPFHVPHPGGMRDEIKHKLHKMRVERGLYASQPMVNNVPVLDRNFKGNNTLGTPNDNSLAISNGGMVVSVVNSNIRVYDTLGNQLLYKQLAVLGSPLGPLPRTYDPRAIYDPISDRFIVIFLNGTLDTTNNPILCFSQTNDPTGVWNCYKLPGNPLVSDTTWSDYPIVAITKDELFLTFNLLKNNTNWDVGFTRSLIWQVQKSNGYDSTALTTKLYSEIKYDGRYVWSICPVHAGDKIEGPNMYFLSVRPDAEQNDTVFLHEVTNTIASGAATLTQKLLKTTVKYGVPPNGDQPPRFPEFPDSLRQYLQTNDARILDASYRDNKIYFVGNTVDMSNLRAGVHLGEIINPSSASPAIRGRIYSDPAMDFGYPSIVNLPAGGVMTFSHSSRSIYPGTSAAFMPTFDGYIDRIVVKEGSTYINVQTARKDTIERWGDYTGIQLRYNDPNAVWLSGSFGVRSGVMNTHQTWIGEVRVLPAAVGRPALSLARNITFPNPTSGIVKLVVGIGEVRSVTVVNTLGVTVQADATSTPNGVSIDLMGQPEGIYHITIHYNDDTQETQKIMLDR